MSVFLLILVLLLGLVTIPFGLPGTWIIAAAALGYSLLVPHSVGMVTFVLLALLALGGEVIEWTLTASYTRKYGGSRRASWGAILGGIVGAIVGVPIPVVGSVIGAFAGAFAGAFVFEMSGGASGETATRVATGALLGRAVASAMKVAIGIAMCAWLLFAAIL